MSSFFTVFLSVNTLKSLDCVKGSYFWGLVSKSSDSFSSSKSADLSEESEEIDTLSVFNTLLAKSLNSW